MTIKRNGSAVWSGGLKDGKGAVSTGSSVVDSLGTRVESAAERIARFVRQHPNKA